MADALELEDDDEPRGPPAAPPAPAARAPPARNPPQLAPPPTRSKKTRLPGPAGAIDEISERLTGWGGHGLDGPLPFSWSQAPRGEGGESGLVTSAAWKQLASLLRGDGEDEGEGMAFAGRQTLAELRAISSISANGKPPAAPVRSQTLCVMISELDDDHNTAENVRATLVDESGEWTATMHAELFNEHPGCVVVGSAWALKRVGVLTLAPWAHHLIVTKETALHAVPPEILHRQM